MKNIKTLDITVQTVYEELLKAKPVYIEISGLHVNLHELTAALLNTYTVELAVLKSDNRRKKEIMAKMLPDICDLIDSFDTAATPNAL